MGVEQWIGVAIFVIAIVVLIVSLLGMRNK